MKHTTGVVLLLGVLGGCASPEREPGAYGSGSRRCCGAPPTVPGMQGPHGEPVVMAAPYSSAPPGAAAAQAMLANSVPLDLVQAAPSAALPSGIVPAGLTASGPSSGVVQAGVCPPGGCGPAVMPPAGPIGPPGMPYAPGVGPAGAVAAVGALTGGYPHALPTKRTSVRFLNPAGMKVAWYAPTPDGRVGFANTQVEVPGRYNFIQSSIYRLKLTDIPNRPGLDLYPTLEVVPSNFKTDVFLAHSSVPVSFTDEDFDQVATGNFVIKVIYLPDPQFQDLAITGAEEVVSSRLEPGVDPIAEAGRRGNILLVVRIGNIDLEAPNTPPLEAPPGCPPRIAGQMPSGTSTPGPMMLQDVNPGMPPTVDGAPLAGFVPPQVPNASKMPANLPAGAPPDLQQGVMTPAGIPAPAGPGRTGSSNPEATPAPTANAGPPAQNPPGVPSANAGPQAQNQTAVASSKAGPQPQTVVPPEQASGDVAVIKKSARPFWRLWK